jgi:hypothetical protein
VDDEEDERSTSADSSEDASEESDLLAINYAIYSIETSQ